MTEPQQYVVADEAPCPAVAVAERMQILVKAVKACCYHDGVGSPCRYGPFGGFKHLRHSRDELLVVAKHGVASRHVGGSVFARYGVWRAVGEGVEGDKAVDVFQQLFVERVAGVAHHVVERLEVVEHLKGFEQRFACWYHAQAFLFKLVCVVYRERVALNGTRMCGEKHLVEVAVLVPVHLVYDESHVFRLQTLIVFDFFFKRHSHIFFPRSVCHVAAGVFGVVRTVWGVWLQSYDNFFD